MINRAALAAVARQDEAVRQMTEAMIDHPAVRELHVPVRVDARHFEDGTIVETTLSVLRFSSGGKTDPVALGQVVPLVVRDHHPGATSFNMPA